MHTCGSLITKNKTIVGFILNDNSNTMSTKVRALIKIIASDENFKKNQLFDKPKTALQNRSRQRLKSKRYQFLYNSVRLVQLNTYCAHDNYHLKNMFRIYFE